MTIALDQRTSQYFSALKFVWMRMSGFVVVLVLAQGLELIHAADSAPSIETIVTRMAEARVENRSRLRAYSVTRDYRLFGKEGRAAKSQVVADVSFVPPASKQYTIQMANGMGLGERIVRQMLEHETEIVKNYGATDMSMANYDFRFLRAEELSGRLCYVLEMIPRRKDKILLHGQIWVDSVTYLLHRMEGEPGKVPSWWLRQVHIALKYGDVGGMWLQIASESTAEVRLLGRYTMLSRDVDYRFIETVAIAGTAAQSTR